MKKVKKSQKSLDMLLLMFLRTISRESEFPNSALIIQRQCEIFLHPFHATDFFVYRLKTQENLWFSDVFRGYRKRPVT